MILFATTGLIRVQDANSNTTNQYHVDVFNVSHGKKIFHVPYMINNASLNDAEVKEIGDCGDLLLHITTNANDSGSIEIALPHELGKDLSEDDELFVLLDGEEERGTEMFTTDSSNVYYRNLPKGSETMEFIGTCVSTFRPPYQPIQKEWYETNTYKIKIDENEQTVGISSNSTSYEPFFLKQAKTLVVLATGEAQTVGHMELQIPHTLLGGQMQVLTDKKLADVILQKNDTHSIINIDYQHDNSPVIIEVSGTTAVPEFPIALLVLITTLIPIVLFSRKISIWTFN